MLSSRTDKSCKLATLLAQMDRNQLYVSSITGATGLRLTTFLTYQVRQSAGVGYADPDGEDTTNAELGLGQAIIADVTFKSPPPVGTTELLFILSSGNFFMCIPLPPSSYGDEQVWRIATGAVSGVPPHAPDTKYLQGITDAYGPQSIPSSALPGQAPLTIEKTIWSSRFRTHSAIADTPFTRLAGGSGSIVLIGDAVSSVYLQAVYTYSRYEHIGAPSSSRWRPGHESRLARRHIPRSRPRRTPPAQCTGNYICAARRR